MKRLIYTLARTKFGGHTPTSSRSLADDAAISITMAALGLPLVQRQFFHWAGGLVAVLSFSDDSAMNSFNLRIERALAKRAIHIAKIRIDENGSPHHVRAAA